MFAVLFEVHPKVEARAPLPAEVRLRCVRIVRDYGMHDRREAPQYYPDAPDTGSAV